MDVDTRNFNRAEFYILPIAQGRYEQILDVIFAVCLMPFLPLMLIFKVLYLLIFQPIEPSSDTSFKKKTRTARALDLSVAMYIVPIGLPMVAVTIWYTNYKHKCNNEADAKRDTSHWRRF